MNDRSRALGIFAPLVVGVVVIAVAVSESSDVARKARPMGPQMM